jgi:transposase
MPQIHGIRELSRDGHSIAEISRKKNVDEKTVRKYLKQDDFSPRPPEKRHRTSRLDPHKQLIDTWLKEDQARWRKQRHTAKRIHERLKQESPGFNCSYNIVQRYVKAVKSQLRSQRASQELVWHPGEAQGDFGEADFIEGGVQVRKKYLILSRPSLRCQFGISSY